MRSKNYYNAQYRYAKFPPPSSLPKQDVLTFVQFPLQSAILLGLGVHDLKSLSLGDKTLGEAISVS